MRPIRVAALALTLVLSYAGPGLAKKSFLIDEGGARPRDYRVTAMCKGLDCSVEPDVYRRSLFDQEGKDLKTMRVGLAVGVVEGRTVLLLSDATAPEGTYLLIGDASNLDDMRPLAGITLRGWQVWDMASLAWRMDVDVAPGVTPRRVQPRLLDHAMAVARLVEGVRTDGHSESPENMRVLVSILANYWWWPVRQVMTTVGMGNQPVDEVLADIKALYVAPVAAAAASATPQQRSALAALNAEVLDGALEVQRYYAAPTADGSGTAPDQLMAGVVKLLGELQQSLER